VSLWLSGIGVSRGVVIGRVHKVHSGELDIPEVEISNGQIADEVQRFREGLAEAKRQLSDIREKIPASAPPDIAAFIDTHLLMMQDSAMSDAVEALIAERHCNAEWALKLQRDSLVAVFDQMEDAYLRTRRDDVEHVTQRIQRILLKQDRPLNAPRGKNTAPAVVVADDITPADIIILHQQGVAAYITEYGGPLSHTAILARSLGIPAIVGLHHARRLLSDDEEIILDGEQGHAIASPDLQALEFYRRRQARDARYRRMLSRLKKEPAVSSDGQKITLLANIELSEDSKAAHAVGAEGVGLYRTEFLYMNRDRLPDEEEQYEAYRKVVSAAHGPVTIRTLDLGADKQIDSGRSHSGPTPSNPALGLRAIRLCLKEADMFRVQLRALLRASAEGAVRIMLPMISNLQELRQARHIIEELKVELRAEGLAFDNNVPVGAMIEVPAAALAAPMLARYADFFSLGTNDLIQYTLAIDRVDDEVNYLYDPLHPAVLRLIHMSITSGQAAGIPVSMCGEMASDPRYTHLLLGLGLTEFSMHPSSILEVKRIIMQSNIAELRIRAAAVLESSDAAEMHERIAALSNGH